MHAPDLSDPALTIALALAAGMLAQVLARHLRVPGIVLLLATGVALGPDVLDVVRPQTLGPALRALVGYAVAVVLFEGGLSLDLRRLRREARSIRQLVTLGALTTAVGAALASRWTLGWSWQLALLFGTLVVVTGPTVINPLLRRVAIEPRVATVLAAEGVLVDAIGAIVAVVALEVLVGPRGGAWSILWDVPFRLVFGALAGALAGVALAWLLRSERRIPRGLESIFTFAAVIFIDQVAAAIVPESGIVAALVAGVVVGNLDAAEMAELREFKEQLAELFVGLLFVLLAADVQLREVRELGTSGLALVAMLMLVVRPLNVAVGTWGTGLGTRERAFLSWVAPRGIVAAAVASLVAQRLTDAGIAGGPRLRAMVFLVIAATVVVQGLTAPVVAGWLGLRRPSNDGYAILGANPVGLALARALRAGGERLVLIDSNFEQCQIAAAEGFDCLHGSAFDAAIQERLELHTRAGAIGVTRNEEVNLLFARRSRKQHRVPRAWVALQRGHLGIDEAGVHDAGAHLLFGRACDLVGWFTRLADGRAAAEWWSAGPAEPEGALGDVLPLATLRAGAVLPVDEERGRPAPGDGVYLLVTERGRARLSVALWKPLTPVASAASG